MRSNRNRIVSATLIGVLTLFQTVSAQHFQRLGGCPSLGCVFPPDQTDFYPGQLFDVRLEVHAPVNGSQAFNRGVPDERFTFCVSKGDGKGQGHCENAASFFHHPEPNMERWTFTYFEDLFAADAKQPTVVNVASKAYRALSLDEPGEYTATLTYYGSSKTVARWNVRSRPKKAIAKNLILFIGDGMTQAMITAARLIGHKTINGRYQSVLQLDKMESMGVQMTHSMDSFITDSANSASAMYAGKKTHVSSLNVWVDSTPNSFDDPKMETMAEMFKRLRKGGTLALVSTAFIADATPAAMCSHTANRDENGAIIFEYLNGAESINSTLKWPTNCGPPDVIFGGGAENFIANKESWQGKDMYKEFQKQGYQVVFNGHDMQSADTDKKTLGIFCIDNMAKWVDRQVLPQNLRGHKDSPTGDGKDATDQPGLKEMTLKAIDILRRRSKGNGFMMMSEAASIDKMMHVLDYDRALGELLELDDTVKATMEHLEKTGDLKDTLIVVTADHGHGFDVFGSADTKYLVQQSSNFGKRRGVGTYENSGLSQFQVAPGSEPINTTVVIGPQGPGFPVQWESRYKLAAGFGANPDHRENYKLTTNGPRLPAVPGPDGNNVVNPQDNTDGFLVGGTLGGDESQGVHSLTDVSVFATGPGSEMFRGVHDNTELFFSMVSALGL